jgi:hypothetical protein
MTLSGYELHALKFDENQLDIDVSETNTVNDFQP